MKARDGWGLGGYEGRPRGAHGHLYWWVLAEGETITCRGCGEQVVGPDRTVVTTTSPSVAEPWRHVACLQMDLADAVGWPAAPAVPRSQCPVRSKLGKPWPGGIPGAVARAPRFEFEAAESCAPLLTAVANPDASLQDYFEPLLGEGWLMQMPSNMTDRDKEMARVRALFRGLGLTPEWLAEHAAGRTARQASLFDVAPCATSA